MPFDRNVTVPSHTSLVLPGGVIAAVSDDAVFIQGGRLDTNDAIRLAAFLARFHRETFEAEGREEARQVAASRKAKDARRAVLQVAREAEAAEGRSPVRDLSTVSVTRPGRKVGGRA